jgi:eukaryotic-like serine/threonine-protein kinase
MTSVLDSPLEPGTVVAGKYRIERVIGQGGMGIVAAAQHIQLEQRVALKLMLPHAISSGEAVSRFLREARAAARISSEHVARVFDVGSLESGEPYIAMEYLEGQDIAAVLAARGHLGAEETVDYVLQGCEALAEAHAVGIVHRDLKPGNLFLVRRIDGQVLVKVLDFGISKVSGGAGQSNAPATRTSALMGSPLYMSPEQMGSAKAVDARSDVWALGVVLYEMLCGQAPFNGETLPQVCAMVMSEAPPPLETRAPGLPGGLYEVVQRCLEKQPAARYQSIAELALALQPLASVRGQQSVQRILHVQGVAPRSVAPAEVAAVTGASPPAGTYAPWGETKPPMAGPRRGALPLALGGLLTVLSAGGAWLGFRSHSALPSPATTSALPDQSANVTASNAAGVSLDPAVAPLPSLAPAAPSASAGASAPALPAARVPKPSVQRLPKPEAPRVASAVPPAQPVAPPPVPVSTRSRL